MNVITTRDFVAGIYASWSDAEKFLETKPADLGGFTHTNSELQYPFFLIENGDSTFTGFQTEQEARASDGIILYTITEDYVSDPPWSDQMGSLPHTHLKADDDEYDDLEDEL